MGEINDVFYLIVGYWEVVSYCILKLLYFEYANTSSCLEPPLKSLFSFLFHRLMTSQFILIRTCTTVQYLPIYVIYLVSNLRSKSAYFYIPSALLCACHLLVLLNFLNK